MSNDKQLFLTKLPSDKNYPSSHTECQRFRINLGKSGEIFGSLSTSYEVSHIFWGLQPNHQTKLSKSLIHTVD